jgi:DNA gyrase subunit A
VFISENGMVQRTSVRGISRQGRDATGVRVMNVREDDRVSAVALVVESESDEAVEAATVLDEPVSLGATGVSDEPALQDDGDEITGGGVAEPEGEGAAPDSDLEE